MTRDEYYATDYADQRFEWVPEDEFGSLEETVLFGRPEINGAIGCTLIWAGMVPPVDFDLVDFMWIYPA